ncbi:MAG: RnfABCDGE type electron transport complex subunit B [Lautropia sp.]|nr:RnfABCDGE type electron transport complex subunit B [Lautropia sp.]
MTASSSASLHLLAQRIDQLLPQTQCRRCGYDDCHDYASALARGETDINRCPPGQEATIVNLAQLLKRPVLPLADDLDPMPARQVVRIQTENCIGCTKCILACPVDAIVGAPKFLHQVLADRCTGCELCLPPCPTDCIEVVTLDAPWEDIDATHGRQHHQRRNQRLEAERQRGKQPARKALAAQASSSATPASRPDERDPLIALATADEKAQRLAAIRARLGQQKAAANTASENHRP